MHEVFTLSQQFFALPEENKAKISMDKSQAWRGWFPLGSELTSGKADGKQGIYFGNEDSDDDPRPMRAPNLFPDEDIPEFRNVALSYIDKL